MPYLDIKKLVDTYGKDATRQYLRRYFRDAAHLPEFAAFFFPHFITLRIPDFHRELYRVVTDYPDDNIALAAPRGFAKSTSVDTIYAAFELVNEYLHYILMLSDSYTQSVEFAETLKIEFESNERLQWVYGNLVGTSKWTSDDFILANGCRVQAIGAGMKVRGRRHRQYRPELIIVDDLENDELVASAERREKLEQWFKKGVMPALARYGRIIYIGTLLHKESLLSKIVEQRRGYKGWITRRYDAIADGKSLWPEMYTLAQLLRMRDDPSDPKYLGTRVFNQELRNMPMGDEDVIIREEWLKDYTIAPQSMTYFLAVDPAISKKESADFTAMVVVGTEFPGDPMAPIYLVDYTNKRLSFNEQIEEIQRLFDKWRPVNVGVEVVSYQEALAESLPMLPIIRLRPDADKVRRTLLASKFFEAGQIFIPQSFVELREQLTGFPQGKHDDLVDATIYAIMLIREPVPRIL